MTILQALDRYYGRMAARGDVVAPGYAVEPIGIVITLSNDGSIVDVELWRDPTGKRPKQERVPKWFTRSGNGSTPFFLWENTAYGLGVSTKDPGKTARDHAAFKQFHATVLTGADDQGLSAFRQFLAKWTPDQFAEPLFTPAMMAWNIAFRLDGERQLLHQRGAAQEIVERLRSSVSSSEAVMCLVSGAIEPPARLHPKIKGIEDTASPEVPLVSFNAPAFESYGKKQGDNAPTSEAAAFRYGAALNRMLDRGSRNRLPRPVGDTTIAFWAEADVGEEAAAAAENVFSSMFNPEPPKGVPAEDAGEAARLRGALEKFAHGRPIKDIDPRLEPGTRFHVLGLAPNAARLSVRFWLSDRFEAFAQRLARHAADLELDPRPRGWGEAPALQRLLVKTTALQEKFDNIPPLLAGEMTRAVLSGLPYPRTLLTTAVTRLRAGDERGSGWHAAVIKACINRSEKEKLPVALDPDSPNAAYQLGRLFAVLESAQYAALGRVNASIGDRYYASASSTPARVFGPLLRGLKHHVSDAKKQNKGGWIEGKVGDIMLKLPPDLPKTLRLEDQGRFAVGYYHERATRPEKLDAATETEGENDEQ
ncbi:MAG: type I-C CRISPR-associated protein Cas8c/Csd1 [Devosia sp.]